MKLQLSILVSGLFAISGAVYASSLTEVCHATVHSGNKYMGETYCGKGSVDSIIVEGDLYTNSTNVTGSASISGESHLLGGTLNNIHASGELNVKQSHFTGNTFSEGELTASDANFSGPLTIQSHESHFSNCQTQSISDTRQGSGVTDKFYLSGTHVNGNISFASKNGIVYLSDGSTISGKVIGGKVVNQ